MKKLTSTILAFMVFAGAASAASYDFTNSNSVVATYNDNVVLLSDIKPYLGNNKSPSSAQVHKAVDAYVLRKLRAEWEAKTKAAVRVSESEIDDIVYNEAAKHGLSYSDFVSALQAHGMTIERYRGQIRQALTQARSQEFLSRNVQAAVDREKIEFEGYKKFQIDKANGKLQRLPTFKYSEIVFAVTPLVSDAQAKANAEKVYRDLAAKKLTFAQAAKEYSVNVLTAAEGGYAGTTNLIADQSRGVVEATVSKLKQGQFSRPVRTSAGYAIYKYDGKDTYEADLNWYLNAEYQRTLQDKYRVNSLDQFLMNSVVLKYKDEEASSL